MITFKMNTIGGYNGPSIFGERLRKGLESKKWVWDNNNPDVNIVFASGSYNKTSINVLRLDNLYFDSMNTIGDTDKLNAPIKRCYEEFDKIVFQSKFAMEQYKNHFGLTYKPYSIIYNGVPKTFSSDGPTHRYPFDKTFICSADWRAHKRLDSIITAFKCFPKEKNYGLVVLGNCKERVQHKNIVYLGKVHHTELPKYIRGADAGVHISWLDCSPNVVYEFIACGLPVLCSHNGGTKEIVRDSGVILELEDAYEFNRVDLYHPPTPNTDKVYWGMEEVLSKKVGNRQDIYMKRVVNDYIDFISG